MTRMKPGADDVGGPLVIWMMASVCYSAGVLVVSLGLFCLSSSVFHKSEALPVKLSLCICLSLGKC